MLMTLCALALKRAPLHSKKNSSSPFSTLVLSSVSPQALIAELPVGVKFSTLRRQLKIEMAGEYWFDRIEMHYHVQIFFREGWLSVKHVAHFLPVGKKACYVFNAQPTLPIEYWYLVCCALMLPSHLKLFQYDTGNPERHVMSQTLRRFENIKHWKHSTML